MAITDFSWVNAIDQASIMAGSEAGTLPSSNLTTWRQGRVWRSLAAASWFKANFAAPITVDILALGGALLGATDQLRHRLYDASGAVILDQTVNSDVLPGYALHPLPLAASLTVAAWRCDIVAASRAGAGFFDIARAWAGPVWRPSAGISYGWQETWNDDADNARGALSAALFPGDGGQYRTVDVTLDWMSEDDKAQAKEMARVAGRRGQVLMVPDEEGDMPREAIIGHLDKLQPITSVADIAPPVYAQSFSIIQDL